MIRMVLAAVFLSLVAVGCTDPGKVSQSVPHEETGSDSTAFSTCPVSGEPARDGIAYVHGGQTIHFCSEECKERFKKDPEKYLDAEKASEKPKERRVYEGSSSK